MNESEADTQRITRVIDFRIPLPYLLSIAGFIGAGMVSMWFNVAALVRTTEELQITVKAGNLASSVMTGQVELLKFRIGINEEDIKRINAQDRKP